MSRVAKLIDRVKKEERLSLTEAESKTLLGAYGIPVVEEAIVTSEEDAVSRSLEMGFPVVLKGHGSRLTHKTERGLVKVNLRSESEILEAFRQIKESAGEDWEGCLIQPLVEGKREFVAGLIRDPQFGPTVMFGLGGVFTEVLADAAFCIAPFSETQADSLIGSIKSSKMLGEFRGEKAADRAALRRTLMGLSRLGLEHPEIKEVDINPLIVTPDGQVKAVDALVVLENNAAAIPENAVPMEASEKQIQEIRQALDWAFNAQSVAVVGATVPNISGFAGMFGCMRNFGYAGRLYPVNPKLTEIGGIKAYPNLTALPEKVDLVIVSVPAPVVPAVLRECVATGNKTVHIFTAGFKESGEEEGIRLQEEMEKIAVEGGLNVIGPNCMGIFVPKNRMLTWQWASEKSGPVALISQSGGNAQEITNYTTGRYGVGFSKAVSFGNALTLDSSDFLDYLARDDDTKIIAMYLEGLKDGRRFLKLVTETNQKKPIIIYKGGLSETGSKAVASHTGSMAGGKKIWEAFFRQTGAVLVESTEEIADVALAFNHLGKTRGPRTAVLGYGGGAGVSVADNCAKAGLALPAFSPELLRELRKLIPPAGTIIRNPIDAMVAYFDFNLMGDVLQLLGDSEEVDNIIVSIPLDWLFSAEADGAYIEKVAQYLATDGKKRAGGKPMVVVWRQYQPMPKIKRWAPVLENILLEAGIPVYEGVLRAVNALAKLTAYYEFHRGDK
ncbi:MAG: acetate--CoA ligase family protein [Desulfatibacillum sp.]|nr:acetate--CoA ligase family protein [Desulfatibacillum sp.]